MEHKKQPKEKDSKAQFPVLTSENSKKAPIEGMTLEECLVAPELLPDQIRSITKYAKHLIGDHDFIRAIQELVRQKRSQLKRDEYAKKVYAPVEFHNFTAEQLKQYFLKEYQAQNGREIELDEYSIPVLETLCLYFSNDDRFEELNTDYSLNKAIMLQGNVGSGKSSWMRVFQVNQKQSFHFKSCQQITREFSNDGYKTLKPYMALVKNNYRNQFYGQTELGWCFDDLGFETEGKHYGKASNVMVELINAIYDNKAMRGTAHTTTNLTASDIEKIYGNRIRSRMREMYNVIKYDPKAPDRRK